MSQSNILPGVIGHIQGVKIVGLPFGMGIDFGYEPNPTKRKMDEILLALTPNRERKRHPLIDVDKQKYEAIKHKREEFEKWLQKTKSGKRKKR